MDKKECPACGALNALSLVKCMYCGADLYGGGAFAEAAGSGGRYAAPPSAGGPSASGIGSGPGPGVGSGMVHSHCPACGRAARPGLARCLYCGHEYVDPDSDERERNCPRCETALRQVSVSWAVLDCCPSCGGQFYDSGELYSSGKLRSDGWRWLMRHVKPCPHDSGDLEPLACPACGNPMATAQVIGGPHCVLDRCPACRGLWLDAGEADRLRAFLERKAPGAAGGAHPGAATAVSGTSHCPVCGHRVGSGAEKCIFCGFDLSSRGVSGAGAGEDERFCPRCDETLVREGGAVTTDRCPRCDGIFLDSGELEKISGVGEGTGRALGARMSAALHDTTDGQPLVCPACDAPMRSFKLTMSGAWCLVDRCPSCDGLWLDQGELDILSDMARRLELMSRENYLPPAGGPTHGAGRFDTPRSPARTGGSRTAAGPVGMGATVAGGAAPCAGPDTGMSAGDVGAESGRWSGTTATAEPRVRAGDGRRQGKPIGDVLEILFQSLFQ